MSEKRKFPLVDWIYGSIGALGIIVLVVAIIVASLYHWHIVGNPPI